MSSWSLDKLIGQCYNEEITHLDDISEENNILWEGQLISDFAV